MNRTNASDQSKSQTLCDRVSSWRELVERCERKPTRKRVHALRVATLRIQAELADELNDLPRASREAQAMLRFAKLADKVRDALGSVRELDVWIGKLRGLCESLQDTMEYVPRSTRESIHQIERLEERLTKKRERAGLKLVAKIETRRDDLLQSVQDVEKATRDETDQVDTAQGARLLKEFAGIVAEFPVFDEGNLHGFRKKIKKIRYLAERYPADPLSQRIAVQVKKAQDAIGEWHDWQVLARTAGHGKHAKDVEAVELLSSMTAEAFETAVGTCQRVIRRLADLERGGGAGLDELRKASVQRQDPVSGTIKKFA